MKKRNYFIFLAFFFGIFMWFFTSIAQPLAWGEAIILDKTLYRLLFWIASGFLLSFLMVYVIKIYKPKD